MKAPRTRQPRTALVHPLHPRFKQRRQRQNHAVVKAPEDVVARRPVPYADQRKHEDVAQCRRKRTRKRRAEAPLRRFGQARDRLAERKGIEYIIPHPCAQADMPSAQKSPSETAKYGRRKFSARRMPNNSAMPATKSMPPEKSQYCCTEYAKTPTTAIAPPHVPPGTSNTAQTAAKARSATTIFLNNPHNISKNARGTLTCPPLSSCFSS